ncbi:aspartate 1-decarboxylase [Gloeothece citriformis PCC 7424]|uniref:Aspartate 1-decarboxylase n=1 Tax=Gloeothece citriformis (strain PCC 7424) TaxID=65393 RepID=PAND_GLOC7|nr:aspartate 1-decarboxylase [Gloeothece citriformis]B7K6Z1.1 RecName: Full=Aspartate 1-decarboxylase; AltName: Full=Aspartate alpha-decarboxylase; Contains: RecName: Full=Aspartate 1-decarboxylase beta chain; Contains: RecName: Full=Aspartate 1-decarboxylase alpha chain; Flags: Precursor [Gloeothece citriformis PCC 7424]ACK72690.1 aspartate 1-decarboxylase [Gloeothece citriformis PCC 7424]
MGKIRLMHAKLHRVRVTEANVGYIGSITIDPQLLDRVGILPLEEVDIVNLNNGKRFSTYVFPGEAGTGEVCPNGGAALLCQPGDLLIIYAYEERDRSEVLQQGHHARVIVADENNQIKQFFHQTLIPTEEGKGVSFHSDEIILNGQPKNNPILSEN